ncbi:MAG: class II fructose-bisphosphate aldolase [Candidatus Acidiferrales bacterium]
MESARELNVPVIVGTSEGEREFMGVHQAAAVVKSLREQFEFPIFVNADHTHSLQAAIEAAKAGYDWIVFDVSSVPFEKNIRETKEAVEALKSIRPDILVEGEIGNIGSGSEIQDLAGESRLTTPVEAKQFVTETGVDTLAPAVGNRHGMSKAMAAGETRKHLNIERIREIKAATKLYMTLHGASGRDDNDLRQAIAAGITVVHINTEVRLAWRRGFDNAFAAQPSEIVSYKILPRVADTIKNVMKSRLKLFNSNQTRVQVSK